MIIKTILAAILSILLIGNLYTAPKSVVAYNTRNLEMVKSVVVEPDIVKTLGKR